MLNELRLNSGLEVELFVTGDDEKKIAELVPADLQDVVTVGRRIGVEDLKRYNGGAGGSSDSEFFLCGPEIFGFEVEEMLKDKVGTEKVHYESWW